MRVLVLDSTGSVGFAAAKALSRYGNIVYGQTFSNDSAKQLESEEIIPIVSEAVSHKWLEHIPTIDVVIDATEVASDTSELAKKRYNAILEESRLHRSVYVSKLTYIHTSATWLHGNSRGSGVDSAVSETTPLSPISHNSELLWRIAHEQAVLKGSDSVSGVVIRPSVIYGHGVSLMEAWLREATEAKKKHRKMHIAGSRGGRIALVHLDDLAELYALVVDRVHLCSGMVFDASNDYTESTDDILAKIKSVVGIDKGYEYHDAKTVVDRALACTALVRPHAARRLLDWRPRKPGFVDGLHIYYAASLSRANSAALSSVNGHVNGVEKHHSEESSEHLAQITSLKSIINSKVVEISSLKSSLHEREASLRKIEVELSSVKIQLNEVTTLKTEYSRDIRTLEQRVLQKETELLSVRKEVQSSKEEFLRVESQLQLVKETLKHKEADYESLKLIHSTSSHTEIEKHKSESLKMAEETRKVREELRIVKESLKKIEIQHESSIQSIRSEKEQELVKHRRETARFDEEVRKAKEEITLVKASLKQKEIEYESKLTALRIEKDQEVHKFKSESVSVRDEVKRVQHELSIVRESLKSKEIEYELTVKKLRAERETAVEKHRFEHAKVEEEVKKLKEEIQVVNVSRTEETKRIKFLETEFKAVFERFRKCTSGIDEAFSTLLRAEHSNGYSYESLSVNSAANHSAVSGCWSKVDGNGKAK